MEHSQSEVAQLDIEVFIKEHILRLQVSMNKAFVVKVVECLCNLPKDPPLCLFLLSVRVLLNQRVKGVALTILHLDVQNVNALLSILAFRK